MKEEKEDSNSALIKISCHFSKEEIESKILKTKNKKLVKLLLADMRGGIKGRNNLNQQIFTTYDRRLQLKKIEVVEHKPDYHYNLFKFEFVDLLDNKIYYINLNFLDCLYFQNDVDEILIKKSY